MSLFAAVLNDSSTLCLRKVEDMMAALSDCPSEPPAVWAGATLALGCRRVRLSPESHRDSLPLVDNAAGLALTGDIRLDDRETLCRTLGAPTHEPDGRLVLAAWQRWGAACVEHLYGDYSFVVALLGSRRLFCARDAVGVRPLYYARTEDGTLACSNDIRALRASLGTDTRADAHLDPAFVSMMLSDGWSWHPTATIDARVRKVPPGHIAWCDGRGVRARRWWPCRPLTTVQDLTLEDGVARVAPRIEGAVRDRIRVSAGIGVHVSGGLDSGLVAAQATRFLREAGRPAPQAYTWTPLQGDTPTTQEESRLRATVAHLGLDVETSETSIDHLLAWLTLDPTDLPYEDTVVYEAPMLARAQARGTQVMLSGWGGDQGVSSNGNHLYTALMLEGRWTQLRHELRALPRGTAWGRLRILLGPLRAAVFGFPRQVPGPDILTVPWRSAPQYTQGTLRMPVRLRQRMLDCMINGIVTERLESWAALGARHGVRYLFPLLDRRVLESTLTFPHELFRSGLTARRLMRALCATWLPASIIAEVDKEDACRISLLKRLRHEAVEQLARRLDAGAFSSARARCVNVPFVRRWLATHEGAELSLVDPALRFLGIEATEGNALPEEPRLLPLPPLPLVRRLALLSASAAHTPPAQLATRLALTVRRRCEVVTRTGRLHGVPTPRARLHADAPRPIFPPDLPARSMNEPAHLPLAYRDWPVHAPMDWHPPMLSSGTGLDTVMLHAFAYLDALPVETALDLMCDWAAANSAVRDGYWRDAWNGWALSIRVVAWLQWLTVHRHDVADDRMRLLVASIARQLTFLMYNLEEDIRGNHLIKNIRALLWAAAALECEAAATWEQTALRLLAREIPVQIGADGVHFERSPSYHGHVLADLIECAWVHPRARDMLTPVLARMAVALGWLVHPDGRVALLNDSTCDSGHSPHVIRTVLREALGIDPAWGDGAFALATAGFYGLRYGTDYLVVDAGSLGPAALPAHAHAQPLTFELSVGGQRRISNGGVSTYDAGPVRDYERAEASHTCVEVVGRPVADCWSSFRVGRRYRTHGVDLRECDDSGVWCIEATHDGYRGDGVTARRRIAWSTAARCLEVHDALEGARAHDWVANGRVRSGIGWAASPPRDLSLSSPFVLRRWTIHLGFRATLEGLRTTCTWDEPQCTMTAGWPAPS